MALVTVWITTYNHEKFISEAIDSVLSQRVTFDYKIVIGEDCSTDNTREIVKQYKEKFPEKIRLFLPDKNLGMIPMFIESYRLCKGKYIAWLDGDDYWTDPYKLQKQLDFLEAHPDYVFCFHRVTELHQSRNTRIESSLPTPMGPDSTLTVDHFLQVHNSAYALSVMHRNILGRTLPKWYYKLPYGDFGLYLLLLQHGKAKFFHDNMGVYRIHSEGAWSGQRKRRRYYDMINMFKILKKHVSNLPHKRLNLLISHYYEEVLYLDCRVGSLTNTLSNCLSILKFDERLLFKHRRIIAPFILKKIITYTKKFIAIVILRNRRDSTS